MAQLVRKQIYINKRMAAALKRVARQRGVSEAEFVREAVGEKIENGDSEKFRPDPKAWEKAYRFMLSRRELPAVKSEAYQWRREDAYEERESRWERRRSERANSGVQ